MCNKVDTAFLLPQLEKQCPKETKLFYSVCSKYCFKVGRKNVINYKKVMDQLIEFKNNLIKITGFETMKHAKDFL